VQNYSVGQVKSRDCGVSGYSSLIPYKFIYKESQQDCEKLNPKRLKQDEKDNILQICYFFDYRK